MAITRAEKETTLRWDEEEMVLWACTASPGVEKKWKRLGWKPTIKDRDKSGKPWVWECKVPVRAITFRRLKNGELPKRKGNPNPTFPPKQEN